MITPFNPKPAFSTRSRNNDFGNAAFVFLKITDFYPMPGNSRLLEFKNLSKDLFFGFMEAGRASRLTSSGLHPRARRPGYIPEAQKRSDFGIRTYEARKPNGGMNL